MSKSKAYELQTLPFVVPTEDGKYIGEHFGKATNGQAQLSLAHMKAPPGWSEPFQHPEFEEYTFVIRGKKQCIVNGEKIVLEAGQSIRVSANARVQYSNPFLEPCEYLSVCAPAFDLGKVHREDT